VPGLSVPILLIIVSAILFAPLASWLALQRARPWAVWFLFGVALGPIASLLLVLAPPGRCPACGNRSVGWPRSCANCGLAFGSRLAPVAPNMAESTAAPARTAAPAEMAAGAAPVMAVAGTTAGRRAIAPAPTRRAGRMPRAKSGPSTIGEFMGRGGGAGIGATIPSPPVATKSGAPARPSATTLGHRAAEMPAPVVQPESTPASTTALAILGSGVFIAGGESLQIGSRYLLARVGSELQVLGPVHVSPATVAARLSLTDIEPTLVADRLLVAPAKPGHGPELAFGAVLLEHGVVVDRDMRVARDGR
jgi:hypothetical protein